MVDEYESWKEARLQSTGQAHPDDWRDYKEASLDWGQSFDDMDGVDWADHMGGPDDDEIERYYENIVIAHEEENNEQHLNYDEEDCKEKGKDEGESEESIARVKEIVEWLSKSKLARKFKSKEGFFVPKGPYVRLKDGSIVDLLIWLVDEGIKGGTAVAGYSIAYSKPESEYGEKLSFFKIVVDAPFSPLLKDQKGSVFDDDLPF